MYLIGVFFLLSPLKIFCFNINTNHFIVYVDPEKVGNSSTSYFGYTVLLYPGDRKGQEKWVKIGAPKGQDPNIKFEKPGVVYDCPFMRKCKPLDVKRGFYAQKEILNSSWIGGSMDVSYTHQRLAICGYRSIYIQRGDYSMLGSCFLKYLNSTFEEMTPLEGDDHKSLKGKVYYYGQGQAGFSTHFPEKENAVLFGAPGVYNWAGTVIKVLDTIYENPPASRLSSFRNKRSLDRKIYIANAPHSTINRAFDLLGYSITSGYYSSRNLYYGVSTPRGENYKGKVAVVEFDENNPLIGKTSLIGNQFGEYFGASTTSGDLNRDGYDDLVVGAPYHAGKTYNEGAVYVFLGVKNAQLVKQKPLYGQKTNGQFGSAVMFLRDINNDLFGDLAIGAPYEEEFSGVIYIYKGNQDGVDALPCQRIIGRDISPEIRGFGISISHPTDIDENGYNDFVVGAYLSGNAVLLRTNPVVIVQYEMESNPKELKRDTKQFIIKICYSYSHHKESNLTLNRTIVVDEILGRASLMKRSDAIKTILIQRAYLITCESVPIILKKTTNYVAPIAVSLSYELAGQRKKKEVVYISDKYVKGTDSYCVRCPVLDEYRSSRPSSIEVPFSLDCGWDNICQSELTIETMFRNIGKNNTFVVGSMDYLNLSATVRNSAEHAYATQLKISLPNIVNIRQIPSVCDEQNATVIICNIDNPLRNGSEKTLNFELDMKNVNKDNLKTKIVFMFEVMTTSNNKNVNQTLLEMTLKREADITISGKPGQQSVHFGNSTYGMPNFTQIYKVEKIGASPLEKVLVNITIPYSIRTMSGDIHFIKVYPPEGIFAGQPIICHSNFEYITDSKSRETAEKLESNDIMIERYKRQVEVFKEPEQKTKENIVIQGKEYDLVPNRTFFLNCSMEDVKCSSIQCIVGPFEKRQTPATIQIKMMFDPTTVSRLIGGKDMVLYSTQGNVSIQVPANFKQNGDRPDSVEVSSLFINENAVKKIALWIIILAAIAGILLLILVIYGLTKAGFFKRAKKEELKNLKARTQDFVEAEAVPEVVDPGINCSTEGLVDDDVQVQEQQ